MYKGVGFILLAGDPPLWGAWWQGGGIIRGGDA